LKLQPVRGTHDLIGESIAKHNFIVSEARTAVDNYGFEEISTPIFEFSEVFKRTLGEASDIVSKEMYTFEDRGGDSITLRPEGTAPIARAFISGGMARQLPLKLFYQGPMFRYERPQKGRQRQFHQLGIEMLGVSEPQADLECLSLADVFLKKIGLERKYRLVINSLGDEDSRARYVEALTSFFQAHKQSLSQDSVNRLERNPLRILDSKSEADQSIVRQAPVMSEFLSDNSRTHFTAVKAGLEQLQIPFEVDEKLVRGLDYYCETVFEFRTDLIGAQDAILSGGRYDKLIEQMGGSPTAGIGFAAGIERLSLLVEDTPQLEPIFSVVPLGELAEKSALRLCHDLRSQGFRVEMAYSGNMSKRMKKADKVGSIGALILGDDEINRGIATWKNLKTGAQQEVALKTLSAFLTQMITEA
jgi:histidyl-tRNA synthetase